MVRDRIGSWPLFYLDVKLQVGGTGWSSRLQFLRLVYVDGFVRLSEIPFSLALVRIAYGERPR